jgi:RHS repeat-associated protein
MHHLARIESRLLPEVRFVSHRQPQRRVMRALSLVLVAGQVVGSVPSWAAEASQPAPAAAPAVTVNRTVPDVDPVPQWPTFSAEPTEDELFRARVFGEPMVPTGSATPGENRALGQALSAFLAGRANEDFTPITRFLEQHPNSPWRVALLTNLGMTYRQAGYFSRALAAWKEAWEAGKNETEPRARALAERSLAEFLDLSMRFGRHQVLEELLDEVEGRDIGGSAGEKIIWAKRGLWLLKNKHDMAIPSGPTALDRILTLNNPEYIRHPSIAAFHPTFDGAGLDQMDGLAREVGLTMRMAFREGDAEIPLPALVHIKAGHYSAIVREEGGSYLLHDPILGQEIWMTRKALAEESSGYFLIPGRSLPKGWRAVQADEGSKVRGKCAPCHQEHPGAMKPCDETTSCGSCKGLAVASFHLLLVNLTINDSPVGYSPSRGPSVHFQATYNHRETFQPAVFTYSNLGPKWTFNWLSYVQDDPASPSASATVYAQGGGYDIYTGFSGGSYAPDRKTRAVLVRTQTSPIRYEHRLPDGTVEVFSQSDGASTSPRRIFLTELRDPLGQTLTFTYDGSLRLVAATDALGQVSTVSYEDTDPLKITKVTDPFGRFATFQYTGGKLTRITDVIGLNSDFAYQTGDFINGLTTPYGTTTFAHGVVGANTWAEMTDALGGKERVEYGWSEVLPQTEPAANVPTGFTLQNEMLWNYLSLHWTKRAMMFYPGDQTKARQTKWLIDQASNYVVNVPHSRKEPLENRVWYAYPGQTLSGYTGSVSLPSKVARVLDDGQTQLRQYEYNVKGMTIRKIDPVGREVINVYGANNVPDSTAATGTGIDLLQTKVKNLANPDGWDVTSSSTYNAQGQPLTITDAAGQILTYAYDGQGRIQTVTTPPRAGITEERTTTYTYDPVTGDVASVTGPGGVTITYTYDADGRLRTTADSENYTLTHDYDDLDRQTRVTYPDGTYEETIYDRLNPVRRRDRLSRWTHIFYDALQRVVSTRDPEGRMVRQDWCSCGDIERLIDANGNPTSWEKDIQGRTVRELRADGSNKEFTYEEKSGRLKKIKDAKGQETHFTYSLDDKLLQTSYVNAEYSTPPLTWSYTDPATGAPDAYGRVRQMTDGTGTTTYGFHPTSGTLSPGAGQLATVDGPYPNDTITHTYDELGRAASRTMNGATTTWVYDQQGRLSSIGDPIGIFTYTYVGNSGRVATATYPNGQTSSYAYLPVSQDLRLQEIHHRKPDTTTLNRFTYTYDKAGNILTWTQQADANPPSAYDFEYDRADQLRSATYRTTGAPPTILKRYRYAFDPAGNRTVEQIDNAVTTATYESMNRLVSRQPGGVLSFEGTVSEPATVVVGGLPATVTGQDAFKGTTPVSSGTGQVAVQATDASGNVRTNTYEVTQAGATNALAYDANGNLTSDGTRFYDWDAANRLLRVTEGANTLVTFTYDASGRRSSKSASGNTTTYVYDDAHLLEERPAAGTTKRYVQGSGIDMPLAHVTSGAPTYYVADHLGSVARTTTAAGMPGLGREYDPWGNPLAGATTSGLAFTGREWDAESGLMYYRARYFSPTFGRFLSEDPLGTFDGPNRYAYVRGNPIRFADPFGLKHDEPIAGGPPPYSENPAAFAALQEYNCTSKQENREYCGWIYECKDKPGYYSYTKAKRGTEAFCDRGPAPQTTVAAYHTHGSAISKYKGGEVFSSLDKRKPHTQYLATPSCRVLLYNPVVGADPARAGRYDGTHIGFVVCL